TGNTAVYDISLGFGTGGATNTIQSMQGFFLKAVGANVTTTVEEADKIAGNAGGFFGGAPGEVPPALRLQITTAANQWRDEVGIVFHAGESGYDAEDVLKYTLSANGAPRISTLAGTTPVAINAHGPLATGMTIPVLVQAGVSGTHTLTVIPQGDYGISCITLEDLATGAVIPLAEGGSYTFELSTDADPAQPRFLIHATPASLLYAEDATCGGTSNGQATLVVQGPPTEITWYDNAGNALLTQAGATGANIITGLDAGAYMVTVATAGCGTLSREFSIDAPFVLEALGEAVNASCADAQDGLIDLMVLGGTAPYAFQWDDAAASTSEDLVAGPGSYTVTITDANGCTWNSAPIAIGNDGPVAVIEQAPSTAMVGQPVQFIAGTVSGSYFWSFGDGESSTAQDPLHTFAFPGTYTVVLAVQDGDCGDATSVDVTVELGTAMQEAAVRAHRAWAGPQGIVVEHAFGGKAAVQADLLDATGRLVLSRRMAGERMVLPVEALTDGLWFVRLTHGQERAILRVPLVR
ncbi:MAG: PKD domain-containing protein, partial [Flavobacteriales bacterium]